MIDRCMYILSHSSLICPIMMDIESRLVAAEKPCSPKQTVLSPSFTRLRIRVSCDLSSLWALRVIMPLVTQPCGCEIQVELDLCRNRPVLFHSYTGIYV